MHVITEFNVDLPNAIEPIDRVPSVGGHHPRERRRTAYHASKKAVSELVPGTYCAIIGIGGLGHIGLQAIDAMSSAQTIAIDIKDQALSLAERLGVDYTVNSTEEDVADAIEGITDGAGAKQVLDFVGADATTDLAPNIVSPGGDHHIVGYGGHIHRPSQDLVDGEFSYRGNLVGTYTELQELVALVEQGEIHLDTTEYDLEDINTVAEKLEHNEIEGRAVIRP